MSLFSGLFSSSKKTNLTPNITPQMPSQTNPEMYGTLSNLAKNYTNNIGTGFGDNYVSKSLNPVAQGMNTTFQQQTSPYIQNQFAKNGTGYSSLAADAQNKAFSNNQNAIDQLMSQFYQLNESQKKSDQQYGANLGQDILTGDVAQQNKMASASADLANATNKDAMYRQGVDSQRASTLANTAGQGISQLFSSPAGMGALNSLGLGGFITPSQGPQNQGLQNGLPQGNGQTGIAANILGGAGGNSLSSVAQLIPYLAMFGM